MKARPQGWRAVGWGLALEPRREQQKGAVAGAQAGPGDRILAVLLTSTWLQASDIIALRFGSQICKMGTNNSTYLVPFFVFSALRYD